MMDDLATDLLTRLVWASVFLAGAGALGCVMLRLLQVKSPGIRATIWWVVLLHGLLLFHVTLAIPWYEPSGSAEVTSAIPVPLMPVPALNDTQVEPVVRTPSAASEPAPVVPAIEEPSAFRWLPLVGAVWLGGMLFVLSWWSWSYTAFLRTCRSRPCDRRDWTQQWETLLKDVGVEESIPIHLGYRVGPALCLHPSGYRLIIPVRLWRRLSSEQRRCVMLHELAHYRRGDVWRLLFARLLALPHWFNPLAWHAVRAIELATEYACDDFAGQGGGECTADYAKVLLAIGESASRPPASMTAGGGGCLFNRISRVLSTSEVKDSGMKKALILVVSLVAMLAAVVRVELVAQQPSQGDQHVDEPGVGDEQVKLYPVRTRLSRSGEEITSSSEKRLLAAEMLDKYKANSEAIRTWTGKVDVEEVAEFVNDGRKILTNSTVTFWSDELSTSNKTTREVHECFEEDASGDRKNLVRKNDALLLKDGETYTFPTYYTPGALHERHLRQLNVGRDLREIGLDKYFFPALGAMNEGAYMGYFTRTYFPSLMKGPDEGVSGVSMSREGNIVTIVDKLEKSGVLVLSNMRVFDLDRGASLIRFEYQGPCIQREERWKCEHQQVDGIWIPKRTESTIEANREGLVLHKRMEWRDQILNGDVAMELSPATLGARAGDQAYDYKTGARYLILDKDHPVRKGRKLPKQTKL